MNLVQVANFDSIKLYRCLLDAAVPDREMYQFLRSARVNLDHVFNLLDGALAKVSHLGEDWIAMPIIDEDAVTPIDVVMFSMREPSRFRTVLGLGTVLGASEVMCTASYWAGQACQLVRTPLEWLARGIQFHACLLDPARASSILKWAPGNLAAEDVQHARELVASGTVDPQKLVVPRNPSPERRAA